MWRNVWMGLTERWPALWVTAVFYKALMQTWDSSEWPEWTTTFPEWMECQAEHRAWSWRVQAPYWCFTRCTAVNNALPGPTPQLLLFLWLKKKKPFTSFRSSLRLPQRPWVFCTRHCQVGGIQGNSFIFGSVGSAPLFRCSQKDYTQPNLSISQQWTHSWPLSTPRQLSTSMRLMGLSTLYLLHLAPRVSSAQSIRMLQRNLSPPCISLSLSVSWISVLLFLGLFREMMSKRAQPATEDFSPSLDTLGPAYDSCILLENFFLPFAFRSTCCLLVLPPFGINKHPPTLDNSYV